MKLRYRTAVLDDLDEIMRLVSAAICEMKRLQIDQWDAEYPTRADFEEDIRRKTLVIGLSGTEIAVIYALNQDCDEQYANADWAYRGTAYAVLHRLCVLPAMQRQGIARETLMYMEAELRQRGYQALRLDVFSENPYALRLYRKDGFYETGIAEWRKGRFLLMEKLLYA